MIERGQFAKVGEDVCVVTAIYGDHPDVPEDHAAVWYGQTDDSGLPKVRTVPTIYIEGLERPPSYYH